MSSIFLKKWVKYSTPELCFLWHPTTDLLYSLSCLAWSLLTDCTQGRGHTHSRQLWTKFDKEMGETTVLRHKACPGEHTDPAPSNIEISSGHPHKPFLPTLIPFMLTLMCPFGSSPKSYVICLKQLHIKKTKHLPSIYNKITLPHMTLCNRVCFLLTFSKLSLNIWLLKVVLMCSLRGPSISLFRFLYICVFDLFIFLFLLHVFHAE